MLVVTHANETSKLILGASVASVCNCCFLRQDGCATLASLESPPPPKSSPNQAGHLSLHPSGMPTCPGAGPACWVRVAPEIAPVGWQDVYSSQGKGAPPAQEFPSLCLCAHPTRGSGRGELAAAGTNPALSFGDIYWLFSLYC